MLQVINKNSKPYRDRWNGEDFLFEPNRPTVVSEIVARHFFGYGLDDAAKMKCMTRAGWLKDTEPESLRYAGSILANFVFKEVEPNWKEVLEEPATAGGKKAA